MADFYLFTPDKLNEEFDDSLNIIRTNIVNFIARSDYILDKEYDSFDEGITSLIRFAKQRSKSNDDVVDNDLIEYIAEYGKCITMKRINDKLGNIENCEIINHNIKAYIDIWNACFSAHSQQINEELNSQVDYYLSDVLKRVYENKDDLNDIHELFIFTNKRDNIELFLLGCDELNITNDYRAELLQYDDKIKSYFEDTLINKLRSEQVLNELMDFVESSLPSNFWWRHIDWNI